jgi:hypothetical protein
VANLIWENTYTWFLRKIPAYRSQLFQVDTLMRKFYESCVLTCSTSVIINIKQSDKVHGIKGNSWTCKFQMHVVRVSNIMGIESKPFNPRTYVEEEHFVTDETGHKQRIRLEDNVVRWRIARDRNGGINVRNLLSHVS